MKAIVTTTINSPTKAIEKFAEIGLKDSWTLIIVGDQKTPHDDYIDFATGYTNVVYVSPEMQEETSKELSDLIGWNCIQRRNFGLIEAYRRGADIIATIDDDNIPYDSWGRGVTVGKEIDMVMYESHQDAFDPVSLAFPQLWHRGFPVQLLADRKVTHKGYLKREVLVQADLWDGDPDIDAICRIAMAPIVEFKKSILPFGSNRIAPFNSQNTFLSRKIIPYYFLFPHIGRMDDIWAAYYVQSKYPDSVVFSKASVFQERNQHDLVKDLEAEMLGYRHNHEIIKNPALIMQLLPDDSRKAFDIYQRVLRGEA